MKTLSVTICIPAYNEEANIGSLIQSLLKQHMNGFDFKRIIVMSDGSDDSTNLIVTGFKDKKVTLMKCKEKLGRAMRQNQVFNKINSDIAVLLDADIKITDRNFITNLVEPIISSKAHLTAGKILELPSRTYFEQALYLSMRIKEYLFNNFSYGQNLYNCHGPARAFAKLLYKQIHFPESAGEDLFSYLTCKKLGLIFAYAPNAIVKYQLPANINDHFKQSIRFRNALKNIYKYFPISLVRRETTIPKKIYLQTFFVILPMIVKHIDLFIVYLFSCLYICIKEINQKNIDETWHVKSTKINIL